jgi:hypothetical protein
MAERNKRWNADAENMAKAEEGGQADREKTSGRARETHRETHLQLRVYPTVA